MRGGVSATVLLADEIVVVDGVFSEPECRQVLEAASAFHKDFAATPVAAEICNNP